MIQEINKEMEALIRGWGLPEVLKEQGDNIDFKFDDNGLVDTEESGYGVEDGKVKFAIWNKRTGKVLFTMDFHKPNSMIIDLRQWDEKTLIVDLLYVHKESLRKKGISSFYIEKIKSITEHIYVIANTNADKFKGSNKVNALTQKELKDFYEKRNINLLN
ncbi:hypothetical protein CN939_21440 [Bacillus thuringiensis]|uniref:hypothetical protein n=1 Tax=Bacillus thuringiensis TaxID=1428 RepID=UPI000BFE4187|nr:hypothetical protein [Bacillus thuringiensis]PGL61727.1 hypothetical protein CN939_21440 [Bacillus thuringiensis]